MSKTSLGALVLAGGDARRMQGRSKALLELDGRSFLQRLSAALDTFDEKLLSTNTPALAEGTPFLPVADRIPGRGPLEGLCAALTLCKSDGLVVAACDMPLFPAQLAVYLAREQSLRGCAALGCQSRDGRRHPLCGVYTKACLPALENALAQGHLRVMEVFSAVGGVFLPLAGTPFPDWVLSNVNTPEELARLSEKPSWTRETL